MKKNDDEREILNKWKLIYAHEIKIMHPENFSGDDNSKYISITINITLNPDKSNTEKVLRLGVRCLKNNEPTSESVILSEDELHDWHDEFETEMFHNKSFYLPIVCDDLTKNFVASRATEFKVSSDIMVSIANRRDIDRIDHLTVIRNPLTDYLLKTSVITILDNFQ